MGQPERPPLLFLSHHRSTDREVASRLLSVLRDGLGLHEPWQILYTSEVATGLKGGENLAEVLGQHLRGCRKVVVLLSEDSLASPWVLMEAGAAFFEGKILPVVMRSVIGPESRIR